MFEDGIITYFRDLQMIVMNCEACKFVNIAIPPSIDVVWFIEENTKWTLGISF
jgi:hypothetical protein